MNQNNAVSIAMTDTKPDGLVEHEGSSVATTPMRKPEVLSRHQALLSLYMHVGE